jgi:CRP-like cAMP-binding protein
MTPKRSLITAIESPGAGRDEAAETGGLWRAPSGATLVSEAADGDHFFLIEEGHAEVSRAGHILGRLGPGSFFGEMGLLDSAPSSATVKAAGPVALRVFDRQAFDELMDGPSQLSSLIAATADERRTSATLVAPRLAAGAGVERAAPALPRPARRRRRRSRPVAVAAAVLAVLVAAGGGAFVMTQRDVATPVSLADAMRTLRAGPGGPLPAGVVAAAIGPSAGVGPGAAIADPPAAASAPGAGSAAGSRPAPAPGVRTSTVASAPFSMPPPGVYAYATTGGESISMFGAHHDYPARTYAVVRSTGGCGWEFEQQVVAEHTDYAWRCSEPGKLFDLGEGSEITFFGQTDGITYHCRPPALMLETGMAKGMTGEATCVSDQGDQAHISGVYDGTEPMTIGPTTVQAAHLSITTTLSGRANGGAKVEMWLDPDTGLMVEEFRNVDSQAHATFGNVRYQEHATFRLQSLTPAS